MLKNGAIEETKKYIQSGLSFHTLHTSNSIIGLNEIGLFLDKKISVKELKEKVVIKTRQYAKRQRTWQRGQMQDWKGFDGYEVYFMGFIETIVSEKVEEIKKEIPGIKSKKAKSRLISMIASEIENITGKNHDDARDYVLHIQQYHTRDYYSPEPLITVTSNQESTEIKSRLESLGVKIEVAGVASIKATEPYLNLEVDELISHPSINAYGFSGSGANGWNGELELDKKGVSLVSLKS